MIRDYIRKDLLDFHPYVVEEGNYRYKLDANESPFNMSPAVKENVIKWIQEKENLNIYPDTDCRELREQLADFWGVHKDNIVCGVGSDQLIDYITKLFLEPGDKAIMPTPSFSMYKLCTDINHGTLVEVPLIQDIPCGCFTYDMDSFIETAKKEAAKIIFICVPNNPTGNDLTLEELEYLLSNVEIPVVVDQAYGEFSDVSAVNLINRYPHLIVLKTFSKAYGLAGARVGFGVADKETINAINLVRPPYNLSTISQIIAIEALKDGKMYRQRIQFLTQQRKKMMAVLEKLDWLTAYASGANFIYVESEMDIYKALKERGIIIRSFGNCPGTDTYRARITIGAEEANQEVLSIIQALNKEE